MRRLFVQGAIFAAMTWPLATACGGTPTGSSTPSNPPPTQPIIVAPLREGAPPSTYPPEPSKEKESAQSPGTCDDQRSNTPCVFLLQGKCFLLRAPNTTYEEQPCPTPPPPLVGEACHRLDMCRGVSDEGCCVDCQHPMKTRIPGECAKKIAAAVSCDEVSTALGSKSCAKLR